VDIKLPASVYVRGCPHSCMKWESVICILASGAWMCMYVYLKLVFHVANNNDNDINISLCIGDAVSNISWFLKVHKA